MCKARATVLNEKVQRGESRLTTLQEKITVTKQTAATFAELDGMAKPKMFGKVELSAPDWKTVSSLAKKGVTADSEIADLKNELAAARRDAQIYKSRWERLMEETKLFREAVKRAPRLVMKLLASVFHRPPEKKKVEHTLKRRNKDMAR